MGTVTEKVQGKEREGGIVNERERDKMIICHPPTFSLMMKIVTLKLHKT